MKSFMHGLRTSATQTAAMATASLLLTAARTKHEKTDQSLFLYSTVIAAGVAAYSVAERVNDRIVYLIGRLPLGAVKFALNERLASAITPAVRRSAYALTTAASAALGVKK